MGPHERPEPGYGAEPHVKKAQALGRGERLRRQPEFKRVYERGVRCHGRLCTVFLLPNQLPVPRLGIAATRKLGGAVQRNRAKRLIREVFRQNKLAAGLDVVVVARRELVGASLSLLETEYRTLVGRARRALPSSRV